MSGDDYDHFLQTSLQTDGAVTYAAELTTRHNLTELLNPARTRPLPTSLSKLYFDNANGEALFMKPV